MIKERGRVVALESDSLWVETIQQSSCGSCSAKKGCGQKLWLKAGYKSVGHIRVLLQNHDPAAFKIDDYVEIGIAEHVISKGSLLVYMVPLLGLLGGAIFGDMLGDKSGLSFGVDAEAASVSLGLLGLVVGGAVVRMHSFLAKNDKRFQPVVISHADQAVLASEVF